MADFNIEILTPVRTLLKETVNEVVLPAYDGESGMLAHHEDFVGALGTGALKLIKDGNDYWYMVSGGVYEIRGDALTILADTGELPEEIDVDSAKETLAELKDKIQGKDTNTEDYAADKLEYDRAEARLEVHRRTDVVN